MNLEEVDELRSSLISKYNIKKIMGVNRFHVDFLWDQIIKYNPKNIVEIGCCTGMSTGFMAKQVSDDCKIYTIDFAKKWFEDESKEIGFLLKDRNFITENQEQRVLKYFGKFISLDVEDIGINNFEMAFIDACHTHPWPTLDMMVLLPFMSNHSVVVHHDLSLWKCPNPKAKTGVGPQYVYDSFDVKDLEVVNMDINPERPDIFAVHIKGEYPLYEESLAKSISKKPWTVLGFNEFIEKRFRDFISRYYTSTLLDAFNDAVKEYRKSI